VFAWSEVLDKKLLDYRGERSHRNDIAAIRLRLVATKNLPCEAFPDKDAEGKYPDNVILDFDYWALMPCRV
jgi:2-methylfumaryl-CoA hydratase